MATVIVQSFDAVTLIGGGAVSEDSVHKMLTIAPRLVAADGGADTILTLGHLPAAVIGDFDSLSSNALQAIPADRQYVVAEQETTDFEKCISRITAPFVLALGFSGPRHDHTLSVWNTLVRHPGRRCLVVGETDVVFALPPDAELVLDLELGQRISLFPLTNMTLTGTGLRWPVDSIDFAPDGHIGTSNEALGPVHLRSTKPGMLVIVPKECLHAAITALVPDWSPPSGQSGARGE